MADATGRLMAAAGYAPTILNEGRYRTYLYESPFHWERLEGSYVPSHFRRAYLREDGYLIAELNNGRGWKLYKVNKRKIAETVVVMQRSGNWPRSLAQRYADDFVRYDIPHRAPPGWSGSIQACIEHHPEINNPFSLLTASYHRGCKSHYAPHLVGERKDGILHKSWKRRIKRIRKRQQLGGSALSETGPQPYRRVEVRDIAAFRGATGIRPDIDSRVSRKAHEVASRLLDDGWVVVDPHRASTGSVYYRVERGGKYCGIRVADHGAAGFIRAPGLRGSYAGKVHVAPTTPVEAAIRHVDRHALASPTQIKQ